MIVVINSLGGLVNIQDEDLFQGSTKLNKIDLVAPFADNVIWKANFEMPDGTIKPDDLDGYLFQPSMKIVDNFNVWKLPITFPITQDYGIVTVQLRGYIGETVVCTTSIKLPIQKGVPYASNFEELGDKDQLLQMISDLRALVNTKADKVNYTFKNAENITNETVGIYFVYDDETEQYVSKTLPQEYVEETQYYEVLNTGRIVNIDGELSFEFIDNVTNQSMKLKIEKDKATLNEKQIVVFDDLKASNIDYDNSISGLNAENTQEAIDEIKRNADNINTDLNKKIDDVINNVTKIGDENNNFATKGATVGENAINSVSIGSGANAQLAGSVAIMGKSNGFSSVSILGEAEEEGIAIGSMSNASNNGVAIGKNSTARSYAVQIGSGTNNTANSLQFRQYNIIGSDGKLKTNTGTANSPVMEIVATEKYVKELISKISGGGITLKVVDVLPTEDILLNAIYLVPVENPNGNNYYEEYLYVVDKFEMIGTTAIDLSGYVTSEEFNNSYNYSNWTLTTPNYAFTKNENGEIVATKSGNFNVGTYNPKATGLGQPSIISTSQFDKFITALNKKFADDNGGVSQEDFDKLVNNETQIVGSNQNISIGNGNAKTSGGVAIGYNAQAEKLNTIAIGRHSKASGQGAIAIGGFTNNSEFKAEASGYNSIQIGSGKNSKDYTLQINSKNIYNYSTDTLTVQNIELNGENLANKLENAGGANVTNVDGEITTEKFEGIVHLSEAQYQELIANGSITIGEQTLTYSDNVVYVTPDESSSGGAEGGGSAKKYQHNINLSSSGVYSISFNFINDKLETYTTIADLITDLTSIFGNWGNIPASGTYKDGNEYRIVSALVPNGTNQLGIAGLKQTITRTTINDVTVISAITYEQNTLVSGFTASTSVTIKDTVVEV